MLSLSFIGRLLTLPFYLVWLTLQYFTLGTKFTNKTIASSWRRTVTYGRYLHIGKGLTDDDLKIVANYSVADLLKKLKSKYSTLPQYATVYTSQKDSPVDSSWLTKGLNRNTNDPVLLYLHAGGFAMPAQDSAIEVLANLYKTLLKYHGIAVSILVVDYSLTINGLKYPTQYNQVAYIYNKLVSDGNTNIVVMGDSAGATLALNLAQYLHTSKATTVWPKALICISPWLDIAPHDYQGSFAKFDGTDMFSAKSAVRHSKGYLSSEDYRSSIVNINRNFDPDWLTNPILVQGKMLLIFGENEVLYDEITSFLSKTKYAENFPERVVLDPKGIHLGLFVSETIYYGNDLEAWRNMFLVSKIEAFSAETWKLNT